MQSVRFQRREIYFELTVHFACLPCCAPVPPFDCHAVLADTELADGAARRSVRAGGRSSRTYCTHLHLHTYGDTRSGFGSRSTPRGHGTNMHGHDMATREIHAGRGLRSRAQVARDGAHSVHTDTTRPHAHARKGIAFGRILILAPPPLTHATSAAHGASTHSLHT